MNSKKKSLLIINKLQFGYHTDTYKYCEHLNTNFDITYVCFDMGDKKLVIPNVKVIYISSKGSYIIRGIRFICFALMQGLFHNGVIFLNYYPNFKLFRILIPFKKIVLDIRSLNINKNSGHRVKLDKELLNETKYYNKVTVISEGIKEKLKLADSKSFILPLGSDIISNTKKTYSQIKLLYVGILTDRDIIKSVEGFKLFIERTNCENITYDIIGDGVDYQLIKSKITECGLDSIIKLHGKIPHFELKPFFDKCNVGVSFIPLVDYYDFQPPTKTFEYVLSGMICIATKTFENKKLINTSNGVLCEDSSESFAKALELIHNNHIRYNSDDIRNSLKEFTWSNITNNYLKPFLDNYLNQ